MPAAEAVLLPICVAVALIGILVTGIAWRKRRPGRVVQGVGLVIAPIALYLTNLLNLVWDFVVSVVAWVGRGAFSPTVWLGLGLLGFAVVLWVVGGLIAKRSAGRRPVAATKGAPAVGRATSTTAVGSGSAAGRTKGAKKSQQVEPADPEMAEIEALLKSRGID